jgi:hypothetical protein
LPQSNNQFDFSTISDVILHVQYTARDGGANLAAAAQKYVEDTLPTNGVQLLSLKHQFSTAWHRFLYPDQQGADQELKIDLMREHYPFYARGASSIKVAKIDFVLVGKYENDYVMRLQLPKQTTADEFNVAKDPKLNNIHHNEHTTSSLPNGQGEWSIKIKRDSDTDFKSLPVDSIEDVFLLVQFKTS